MGKSFYPGARVVHKDLDEVLIVEAVGSEMKWPGNGPVRKVNFVGAESGEPGWFWDFELEAW